MNAVTSLAERYAQVRRRIADASARAGRRTEDILLVAVTKYAEPEQIRELIGLGHRDFGENYVQQLVMRASMVQEFMNRQQVMRQALKVSGLLGSAGDAVRWHLIGPVQRNKARKAIEFSRLIHTVDSLRLAEELQQAALKRDEPVEVLVQVNCSGEEHKHGCPPPAAPHLIEQIETMVQVRVRGLMTMAAQGQSPEDARPAFAAARDLFHDIQRTGAGGDRFNILSMGMSGDFEVAIEEGANIVRVGSAIFGERPASAEDDAEGDEA